MRHYAVKSLIRIMLIMLAGIIGCKEEKYVHVGPNWDGLHKLKPSDRTFRVSVSGKNSAKIGDDLFFKITSEKDGRLWVVQVDPEDELSVLFPNQAISDNTISAGKSVSVPPKGVDWSITAGKPVGKSIVAFVVTTGDTDIGDVLTGEKDISKALKIAKSSDWGIEKLVIDIK